MSAALLTCGHKVLPYSMEVTGGGGGGLLYLCREVCSTLPESRFRDEAAVGPQELRACNGLLLSDFLGISLALLARTLTHLHAGVEVGIACRCQ